MSIINLLNREIVTTQVFGGLEIRTLYQIEGESIREQCIGVVYIYLHNIGHNIYRSVPLIISYILY